jgi:bifunctional non-homologous end joining protein LigD
LKDGKDQTVVLNDIELKLTNLDKPYWKKEGFKKIDLINYYLRMAPLYNALHTTSGRIP